MNMIILVSPVSSVALPITTVEVTKLYRADIAKLATVHNKLTKITR